MEIEEDIFRITQKGDFSKDGIHAFYVSIRNDIIR